VAVVATAIYAILGMKISPSEYRGLDKQLYDIALVVAWGICA
jgi:hypothetical protein